MAWYDALMEQGAVPAGSRPKVITEPGGEPGFFQTDKLSTMLRGLDKLQRETKAKEEARQKKLNNQIDMYKTLRDSGYDPKKAYDAVMSGQGLIEPNAEDTTVPKTQREKILDKMARGVPLSPGEQAVYDQTIKHKTDEGVDLTTNKGKLRDRILEKIAADQALTPGEQKVYDETIKHTAGGQDELDSILSSGKKSEENLDSVIPPGSPAGSKDISMRGKDMVPVIAPDGTPGWIPIKKLPAALKAGYKTRKK